MSHIRRLPAAFVLAAAFLAFGVGLAAAKVPYFSVEVTPQAPTAGELITVVVRLWNDPTYTIPADWALPAEVVDEMIAFVSEDQDWRRPARGGRELPRHSDAACRVLDDGPVP